ncbi:RNA polymerase III subunit GL a [Pimephales promelas]|uniref:RNA polymerase III subunit GL a n=1 Tax=Pimephales promelas TaxID=90988 RepID=UPI001955AD88|nr:RNA polymerase III subunit GL a [Pimephales promelas]KAG1947414.1 DNA-directed RNA polymerase III subunit RPC7 [Pimephales promelas]
MAGRGRGRGRSQFTFSVDALGFGRGDSLPTSTHTPSPLFPPMQFRPVPLLTGEEVDYMLALKQELRASSKNLPFHIRAAKTKTDVARYSDKYQNGEPKNNTIEWSPDWSRLPKELCIKVRKPRKTCAKPQLQRKPKAAAGKEEVLQKLETLEKREQDQHSEEEEEEEKKKQDNEEEPDEDEDYDEEEIEDETDYIISYFDNGEEFGADSDDNMDEAVY